MITSFCVLIQSDIFQFSIPKFNNNSSDLVISVSFNFKSFIPDDNIV